MTLILTVTKWLLIGFGLLTLVDIAGILLILGLRHYFSSRQQPVKRLNSVKTSRVSVAELYPATARNHR